MVCEINKQELIELYNKARQGYYECIYNQDNAFLRQEVSKPFEEIEVKNSSVKIVFSEEIHESYSWEISLDLWDESSNIGRYVYWVNDQGEALDDSLVLF